MKILNFGSLNLDYTYGVQHFVQAGETLSAGGLSIFSGGKGLNQSIALSRNKTSVWHAGAIGSDGERLLKELECSGVNTQFIHKVEGSTGHAIIQRDESGDNCILLYGGANQMIQQEWVDETLRFFAPGDLLILQNEINHLGFIMERAHGIGMKIVLNPSPMDEKILDCPLSYVDYFILNEVEAVALCRGVYEEKEMLLRLRQQFPGAAIVLTLGARGAFYKDAVKEVYQEALRVPVVDTTGAGDTFTGYFFGSLAIGMDVERALERSSVAASIAVGRVGAAQAIPYLEDVMEQMHLS